MTKKCNAYIFQILMGIISPLLLGIIFPLPGWIFIINIAEILEKQGISIVLVGEPSTIDYGAVIVAALYLCLIGVISCCLIKKKYKVLGITFLISGFFMAFLVFIMVSSLIWF